VRRCLRSVSKRPLLWITVSSSSNNASCILLPFLFKTMKAASGPTGNDVRESSTVCSCRVYFVCSLYKIYAYEYMSRDDLFLLQQTMESVAGERALLTSYFQDRTIYTSTYNKWCNERAMFSQVSRFAGF
jgi:hypothetical protein